jgi:glycine/D-amino acid oxidase-like deaminating enzyme
MQLANYWAETAPRPADFPLSDPPAETDVAIIGGGYTGLNAALELRKSGVDTTILEAEIIGWGASSRNGGMLTPGLKASLRSIVKMVGMEQARHFWQWSLDAIDHVERLITEEGIACDWQRGGFLALAYKPEHFANQQAHVQWMQREFGYTQYRLVPPAELRAEIGTDSYFGGLQGDHAAGFQPAKYVIGLGCAAGRRGAKLVEHAPVTRIERHASGFTLHTPRGGTRARAVLLATNGYTTRLHPPARSGIFPVGSYIIVTEPLPADLQAELSPRGRMFYDTKHFLNYFRLTPDGRMLFGGRNKLTTNLDLHESARMLQARMLEVFPQLAGVPLTHTWHGKLGITFDLMPHAGKLNGIHYAYGYGGHGASIASYLGREIGQVLAGTRPSSPFMDIRHPRNAIANFDKLYLPFVAGWYRLLDRIR